MYKYKYASQCQVLYGNTNMGQGVGQMRETRASQLVLLQHQHLSMWDDVRICLSSSILQIFVGFLTQFAVGQHMQKCLRQGTWQEQT